MPYNIEHLLKSNDTLDEEEVDIAHNIEMLPICHVTTYSELSEIRDGAFIRTNKCKHFKEELIYFFYGKAKYIPIKEIETYFVRHGKLPVALMMNASSIKHLIKRFVVFDSGGFFDDRYKNYINKESLISDYSVEKTDFNLVKKYIKILYGNNLNYLNFDIRPNLIKVLPEYQPILNIYKLHQDAKLRNNTSYDARAFTIEIQYGTNINLLRGIDFIVVPDEVVFTKSARKRLMSELDLKSENQIITYPSIGQGSDSLITHYILMQSKIREEITKRIKK